MIRDFNLLIAINKGTDQTARKRRPVCVFVVHMHVWFSREVTKITASAKEAPVNSRVQRVSYRHELQIFNFNGVHIGQDL